MSKTVRSSFTKFTTTCTLFRKWLTFGPQHIQDGRLLATLIFEMVVVPSGE